MKINIEKIKQYPGDPKIGASFKTNNFGKPVISILKRKKDSISGKHYHLGKTKSKDPETLVLVSGKVELYLENVRTKESDTIVIEENTLFEIPPYVYHEVKGLADFIALEFNVNEKDQENDTVEGKELK